MTSDTLKGSLKQRGFIRKGGLITKSNDNDIPGESERNVRNWRIPQSWPKVIGRLIKPRYSLVKGAPFPLDLLQVALLSSQDVQQKQGEKIYMLKIERDL